MKSQKKCSIAVVQLPANGVPKTSRHMSIVTKCEIKPNLCSKETELSTGSGKHSPCLWLAPSWFLFSVWPSASLAKRFPCHAYPIRLLLPILVLWASSGPWTPATPSFCFLQTSTPGPIWLFLDVLTRFCKLRAFSGHLPWSPHPLPLSFSIRLPCSVFLSCVWLGFEPRVTCTTLHKALC